jgi:general stress protein 26
MYQIAPALKEFLESGVAIQVGTAGADGKPHAVTGWGARINEDGTVSIFIEAKRASRPLANLATNPKVAVIFGDPISYRSIQLKGQWRSTAPPSEEDQAWVVRHRDLFASSTALVGDNPNSIRNLWMDEVMRIDFDVQQAFDQTPGPEAGRPL